MERIYISVILPLRIEWVPCYYLESSGNEESEDGHIVRGSLESRALDSGKESSGYRPIVRGNRVKVRFAGRTYIGVVDEVGITPEVEINKIQPVISIEERLETISEQELDLWKFVADYYLCSIGEVYKAAYPPSKTNGEVSKVLSEERAEERHAKNIDRKIAVLTARREGVLARIGRKSLQAEKARTEATRAKYLSEKEALEQTAAELGKQIADAESEKNAPEESSSCSKPEIQLDFSLSAAQTTAYEEIHKAFENHNPVLLQGVTGSGKTELHIALAKEALIRGRNVLYLIPEIAVSRQMEERLGRIFGNLLLIFHSKETPARRLEVANAVRRGPYIVLGTRSSIFLPHHDLGLVIVDEEHDTSYKQDAPAPRYNGRDTALVLAKIHGGDAVLSTATPSLESLYNCRIGRMTKVELTEKYYGAAESDVEIIDTSAERRKRGMAGSFSFKLINHIRETLSEGGQVLLLRGRRAYSPSVQCFTCGDIPKCPHCNVPLSMHKQEGLLMCHYCGWRTPYTGICGKCGGELIPLGAGTQKIEEEAAALFQDAKVARLDSDVAMSSGKEISIIRDFAAKKIDILVGTQIVTKGFDFDNLSLVAVLQADSLLAQQDFRADERAVQLLEQFRGRSGRRGRKGLFVIQTSQPSHPVYQLFLQEESVSVNADKSLLDNMMQERYAFGYPPFSRVVKVLLKDTYEARVEKMSMELTAEIRNAFGLSSAGFVQDSSACVSVVGPYSPPVDKQYDHYVKNIRINLRKDNALASRKQKLAEVVDAFVRNHAYPGHIALDVDPV